MKNLLKIVRKPGKEYQFTVLGPDGREINGVSLVRVESKGKNLSVVTLELFGFELMGEVFPLPGGDA